MSLFGYALILAGLQTASALSSTLPATANYCTEAGPIYLQFSGEDVSGSYRIVLPHKNIEGQLQLEWSDGYIHGTWTDPDGSGPIVIVFHDQMQRLTALYTSDNETLEWSPVWEGWKPGTEENEQASQCP